jgi:hypothetical protein
VVFEFSGIFISLMNLIHIFCLIFVFILLHVVCSHHKIVRVIKSRGMKSAGYVARTRDDKWTHNFSQKSIRKENS